jgi:hypothetical protein
MALFNVEVRSTGALRQHGGAIKLAGLIVAPAYGFGGHRQVKSAGEVRYAGEARRSDVVGTTAFQ